MMMLPIWLALYTLARSSSFRAENCSRALSSWQYTFTTFWPETISSMKPFTRPRFRCRSTKYFLDSFPSPVVTLYIRNAISTATTVSGTLSTSMLTKVARMVTTERKRLGTLFPIT